MPKIPLKLPMLLFLGTLVGLLLVIGIVVGIEIGNQDRENRVILGILALFGLAPLGALSVLGYAVVVASRGGAPPRS